MLCKGSGMALEPTVIWREGCLSTSLPATAEIPKKASEDKCSYCLSVSLSLSLDLTCPARYAHMSGLSVSL